MEKILSRNVLQQSIYKIINPLVRGLIRIGLSPNIVTVTGLVLNIGVAVIFIIGAEEGNRGDFSYVGWAGALTLFAGLFDMLDGQVARLGNMASAYGALFDSVLDRYSELFLFLGICYYLVAHHYFIGSLIAFVGMIGSMMVSYTRARAEGLGIESKGGLMQRPERIITISVAAIACGITARILGGDYKLYVKGISFHVFEPMAVFIWPLTLLAILTNATAIRRLLDAGKALKKKEAMKIVRSPVTLFLIFLLSATASAQNSVDSFPVPSGISHQLFYLQRTHNINTIICELNLQKDGLPDPGNPVHVFWMRYADHSERRELSWIQRVLAYGINSKQLSPGRYELRFVSYKKFPLLLRRSERDKNFHVYAMVTNREIILKRIFIKINGGSFWSPNIEYIELKGTDPIDGREVSQRLKV